MHFQNQLPISTKKFSNKVSYVDYYGEFHGHRVKDLTIVHDHLRYSGKYKNVSNRNKEVNNYSNRRKVIFLAGDSTLDNKYWFGATSNAINGYESVLDPPTSKMDISYWMNRYLIEKGLGDEYVTLNCAVEATSIGDRACGCILPQDRFIGDNLHDGDILVVSIGGNDVALKPSPCTACNLLSLVHCTTTDCVENLGCGMPLPCDDCCMGGACGCASNLCAFPCGMGYFIHLFKTRIESIIRNILLTSNSKPKIIYVCMLYFVDETRSNSWADLALNCMKYDTHPEKLKGFIRKLFELATQNIQLYGIEVVGIPLFEVMDGTDTTDYVARVEPSVKGGEKIAKFVLEYVFDLDNTVARSKLATNTPKSDCMIRK